MKNSSSTLQPNPNPNYGWIKRIYCIGTISKLQGCFIVINTLELAKAENPIIVISNHHDQDKNLIARENSKAIYSYEIMMLSLVNIQVRFMILSLTPCLKLRIIPYSSSRGISILGECLNTYFLYKWINESLSSSRENFWPMHERGPIPKGIKAYGCLLFSSSHFGLNLSGLNLSGSGKFFGSFAKTPSANQTHVPWFSK